jgi:hypothetical protein
VVSASSPLDAALLLMGADNQTPMNIAMTSATRINPLASAANPAVAAWSSALFLLPPASSSEPIAVALDTVFDNSNSDDERSWLAPLADPAF